MEEYLQPEIKSGNQLTKVTTLSKYLAMVLFIVMPFIGGYIGYVYAPEKIIETERIVYREVPVVTQTTSDRIVHESFFEIKDGKLVNFFNPSEVVFTFSSDLLNQLNLGTLEEENLKNSSAVAKGNSFVEHYIVVNDIDRYGTCKFSNKIYLLNTTSKQLDLIYEENDSTLSSDDPRACNKEMVLIGTEDNKLIIRYHTLETGGVCDRKWGYPEQTWYLDTSALSEGTKKYDIPAKLYDQAMREIDECVKGLEEF